MNKTNAQVTRAYFLRTFAMIFLLLSYLGYQVTVRFNIFSKVQVKGQGKLFNLVGLLSQMDVFHQLFYSFAISIVLFFIFSSKRTTHNLSFLNSFVVGVFGAAVPIVLVSLSGRTMGSNIWFVIGCIYLGVNMMLLTWAWTKNQHLKIVGSYLLRAVLVIDVLAPSLVWSMYREKLTRFGHVLRIIPALMMAGAPILPWFFYSSANSDDIRCDPAFKKLLDGSYYQVELIKDSSEILVVEDQVHNILRLDPENPENVILARQTFLMQPDFFRMAWDPESNRVLIVDMSVDPSLMIVMDGDSLHKLFNLYFPYENKLEAFPQGYSLFWYPQPQYLFVLGPQGLFSFNPFSGKVLKHIYYQPGDLVLDNKRDQLIVNEWSQYLVALDPKTFEIVRWVPKPEFTERMTLDENNDLLYLSNPVGAVVHQLDLNSFKFIQEIETFFGVRVMEIIPEKNWILFAGFTPFLEVRSLADFRLIDRIAAPPWVRRIKANPQLGKAYITTGGFGVWELDLNRVGGNSLKTTLHKIDLFFPLLRAVVHLGMRKKGGVNYRDHSLSNRPSQAPIETYNEESFGNVNWTRMNPAEITDH